MEGMCAVGGLALAGMTLFDGQSAGWHWQE